MSFYCYTFVRNRVPGLILGETPISIFICFWLSLSSWVMFSLPPPPYLWKASLNACSALMKFIKCVSGFCETEFCVMCVVFSVKAGWIAPVGIDPFVSIGNQLVHLLIPKFPLLCCCRFFFQFQMPPFPPQQWIRLRIGLVATSQGWNRFKLTVSTILVLNAAKQLIGGRLLRLF